MRVTREIYPALVSVGSMSPLTKFYHGGHGYIWIHCHGMGLFARVQAAHGVTGKIKEFRLDAMVDYFEVLSGDTIVE